MTASPSSFSSLFRHIYSLKPVKDWFRQLNVRQKISCGYALTLGLAGLGTVIGILVGEQYQRQARLQVEDAIIENRVLHQMQAHLLYTQAHQQTFEDVVGNPERFREEYQEFLFHAEQVHEIWLKLQVVYDVSAAADTDEPTPFGQMLTSYDPVISRYFQQTRETVDYIQTLDLSNPELLQEAQTLLRDLRTSPDFDNMHTITEQIDELVMMVEEELIQAENAIAQASTLRLQIISLSMVLAVAIAILAAFYTTKAIVFPLKSLNDTAQQVTQESNFDLQAQVNTQDEVGDLALSLNQLIERVRHLLAEQQKATTQQLLQSEKMASLGEMLAGVAHEINNPVNFIYGNLIHAHESVDALLDLIETYRTEIPDPPAAIHHKTDDIELSFLQEDLPKLFQSMRLGADRTRQIVLSLRNFSRLDETEANPVDLHDCLDNTLLILHNRIKKGVTVTRHYSEIPEIEGFTGSLYQVFTNLITNALDAVEEHHPNHPELVITTERLGEFHVAVRITDNGMGIEPSCQIKIFDTFFTTKPEGCGTGLGLAISRQIVEDKHGGLLLCASEVGQGTTFSMVLPIQHHPELRSDPVAIARDAIALSQPS